MKYRGVYMIIDKITDKAYIGATTDGLSRFHNHNATLRRNQHHNRELQQAYNQKHVFDCIWLPVRDDQDPFVLEQILIRDGRNNAFLYNLKSGAGSRPKSQEAIEKHRQARLGFKHSAETKLKISIGVKGKLLGIKRTLEQCKLYRECRRSQMKMVSANGLIFDSVAAAARYFNLNRGTASSRFRSTTVLFNDWRFLGEEYMDLKQGFKTSPSVKILINIGSLMDIPTGFYLKGRHGESILNGGLGLLTAVVGIGNNFKSTLMNYMMLAAASRVIQVTDTTLNTYDTEINIHEDRLEALSYRFPPFQKRHIIGEELWTITDKTVYYANEWYEILKEFLTQKRNNVKKIEQETPFLTRDKVTLMRMPTPTFGAVDSFSEFETADVAKIQNDNELGDSGGNTIHMRQGLAKTRFLMEIPTLAGGASHYMLFTAHIGKDIPMASGPMPAPPVKKLQHLKHGDKLKGVTDKFTFLMSNCWHAYNAAPLINQGTKGPEYPRNPDDNNPGDMDLNIVSMRQLRSKSGPSGTVIEVIVSQSEGVLPELTEFHYIKSNDRFGIAGTMQHYNLELYPDCKLSRTTIRSKIDSDARLRRALNITAELCQMRNLWHHLDDGILCTPKEMYESLKEQGYDWNVLLDTRGYWCFDNDNQPVPFLSTMDLCRMVKKEYRPYWLKQ